MTTFENEYEVHYFNRICKCNKKRYTKHKIYSLIGLKECLECGAIKKGL